MLVYQGVSRLISMFYGDIHPWPMTSETPCPGPLQEFRASFFTSDALHAVHCRHSRRDDGGNGITKAIREVQVGAVDVGRSPGYTLEVGQMSLETLEKGKGMG